MVQRVAVLFGGKSGEHEVSVTSARSVMAALDRERWEVVPIAIAADGAWIDTGTTELGLEEGLARFDGGTDLLKASAALASLASCDAAFPLVHGKNGEDGTLQGFLELAGIPYAGPGVAASAIGMDKAIMKALFQEAGIPVAPYGVLRAWELNENDDTALRFIEASVGYPSFVKPANGGSSVGVSRTESREDMGPALRMAFDYDDKAVVEAAVIGREVEVSVLGNEYPEASVAGEVVPDRTFYDYESKYSANSATRLVIPADLPPDVLERVRELALRTYQVMGCEGYARVDFFVTPENSVIANEVNTIPGFTSISMYPKLWAASGLGYSDLLTRILELALDRHAREARS
jgi:D-alanine-D-alanine ligase